MSRMKDPFCDVWITVSSLFLSSLFRRAASVPPRVSSAAQDSEKQAVTENTHTNSRME